MKVTKEDLQKRIKLGDKCRDFAWIKRQFDKGRLRLHDEVMSKIIFDQLRAAVKATNDIYENSWDLDIMVNIQQIGGKSGKRFKILINITGIVVHFPQVVITNSRRKNHTIRDLFIKIVFDASSNLRIIGTNGGRTTMTLAEHHSGYMHSHLNVRRPDNTGIPPFYSSFCTGSGHINAAIGAINNSGFTAERFTTYLLHLMPLANWESLEGTPYISIGNIMVRDSRARVFTFSSSVGTILLNKIVMYHKTNSITPKLELTFEGSLLKVKDDASFDEFLKTISFSDTDKQSFLCTRDESGTYYQYGASPTQIIIPTIEKTYIFQGKEIPFKISDAPTETSEPDYFIHPDLKQYIKNEIEYDINKKAIRKSTIDRYTNQTSDIGENTESDKTLVQENS